MKLRMAVGALVAVLIATGSYAVVASVRTNDATPVTRDPRDDTASDRDGNAVVNLAECLGADELLAGDDALADEGAASKVPGRVEIRRIIRAVEGSGSSSSSIPSTRDFCRGARSRSEPRTCC